MKLKIVVFGICCLLSACGFGKGGRNFQSVDSKKESKPEQRNEVKSASETMFLSNLKSQSYAKLQQEGSGSQYYYLGSFDLTGLPEELKQLPSESEVGSFTIEFEDEIYEEKYSGEVRSVFKKRQEEIKTTVYLLKESDSSNRVVLAVRDDGSIQQIQGSETAVKVQSSPRDYCYRFHLFPKQIVDTTSVSEQDVLCDAQGMCNVLFNIIRGGRGFSYASAELHSYNMAADPWELPRKCLDYQTYYSVTETKMNRSVPKIAIVELKEDLVKSVKKMSFEL